MEEEDPVSALSAVGSGIASIFGISSQNTQQKTQQQALKQQEAIANQEMADKQQIFNQLVPFFQKYLSSGNPYLAQTQRASAEQVAQGANDAAGRLRETMQTSGLGYGPSGTTAEGIAQIGTGAAATSSSNYLQNLLNSEMLKFQAASGLNTAGSMAGGSQNQPNVGVTLQPANTASAIGAFGQNLGGLVNGVIPPPGTSSGGSLPLPPAGPASTNPSPIFGMPTSSPITQGLPSS